MNIKSQTKPFFRAKVQSDGVLEMLIYEEIGEDFWSGGGLTAKTVKQQIDNAGVYSRISIRINSPGGDAFEGVAIGNLLKSTGKPIDVCIDGIAASAASIIAMCGTSITMANNAMMMIHNAWTYTAGNAKDFRKMADTLDKVDGAIAQTYVDRTGKDLEAVKALMDAETWMSAADCVKDGFATAVAVDAKSDEAMAMAKNFESLKKFAKLPDALKADDAKENAEAPPPFALSPEVIEAVSALIDARVAKATVAEPVEKPAEKPPAEKPAEKPADPTPVPIATPTAIPDPPKKEASASVKPKASVGEGECACECNSCVAGNCADCTNMDCADSNCTDCPMQSGTENASNLSLFNARQWEVEHGIGRATA